LRQQIARRVKEAAPDRRLARQQQLETGRKQVAKEPFGARRVIDGKAVDRRRPGGGGDVAGDILEKAGIELRRQRVGQRRHETGLDLARDGRLRHDRDGA
jgi:hypothetical protein